MPHPALSQPPIPALYHFDAQRAPLLLGRGDPPAFFFLEEAGPAPALLICDHASRAIPASLQRLGLEGADLARHIAWDIGVAEVAKELAPRLRCPAVLSGFSRLVIAANRRTGSAGSTPEVNDGTEVPGNQNLGEAERRARVDQLLKPYHAAVSRMIEANLAAGQRPLLIFLHSFTPVMDGFQRPWEVGILWNEDRRLAGPLIEALRARGVRTGDNEPYSGTSSEDYGLHVHAEARGLPGVLIEVRQDLIDHPQGVKRWSRLLYEVLAPLLQQAPDIARSLVQPKI